MRQALQVGGLIVALAVGAWVLSTTEERAGIPERRAPAAPRAAAEMQTEVKQEAVPRRAAEPAADAADAEERARMEQQIAALLAKDAPDGDPLAAATPVEPAAKDQPAQALTPEEVIAPEEPVAAGAPDWSYGGPDSLPKILETCLPVAQKGNAVAANIARQAMLALDRKTTAYDDLESIATRDAVSEQERAWLIELEGRANAGDAFAAHVHGTMLLFGHGVPANAVRARRLLEQAARAEGWAAFLLAELYARGEGFEADEALAEKHYRQAAIQGLPRATRALYGK